MHVRPREGKGKDASDQEKRSQKDTQSNKNCHQQSGVFGTAKERPLQALRRRSGDEEEIFQRDSPNGADDKESGNGGNLPKYHESPRGIQIHLKGSNIAVEASALAENSNEYSLLNPRVDPGTALCELSKDEQRSPKSPMLSGLGQSPSKTYGESDDMSLPFCSFSRIIPSSSPVRQARERAIFNDKQDRFRLKRNLHDCSQDDAQARPHQQPDRVTQFVNKSKFRLDTASFADIARRQQASTQYGPEAFKGSQHKQGPLKIYSPMSRMFPATLGASPIANRTSSFNKGQPRPGRNIYIREKFLPDELTESILQKQQQKISKAN